MVDGCVACNFVKPENAYKAHVHQYTGQQGTGRVGGFVLGINTGRVHGHQSRFGCETGENKQECQLQPKLTEFGCVGRQRAVKQVGNTLLLHGYGHKQHPNEHQGNTYRANENVFPGSLERKLVPAVIDKRRSAEGGQLNKHPGESNVVER